MRGVAPKSSWILKPCGPGEGDLVEQRPRAGRTAGQEGDVERGVLPGAHQGVQVVGGVAADLPDAAEPHADERGDSGGQRGRRDLGRGQVDVAVDDAGCGDEPLPRHHGSVRVDGVLDVHHVRIADTADGDDPAVLDADVGLAHTEHRVHQDDPGDHHVEGGVPVRARRGEESVADRLAAAAEEFVAGGAVVGLDLHPQAGVAEPDPVAGRGPVQGVVRAAVDAGHARSWVVRVLRLAGMTTTSRFSPGSKARAVPAAMSSRSPRAASRSSSSAWLASCSG